MRLEHNSADLIYRKPFGAVRCGEEIRIRLSVQSVGIPKSAELIVGDTAVSMHYAFSVGDARVYECSISAPQCAGVIFYCFRVEADGEVCFYKNNSLHLGGKGEMCPDIPDSLYQITVYDKAFKTPDWMKNAVVYQIFPDRFCRDGDTPIHGIARRWGEEPFWRAEQFGGKYLANDFFGGNFRGIEKKLDYLKELGITAIYLNPIFEAYSNHRYDTSDYENADSTLGTNEDFCSLAEKAEKAGIKIILDGVFSHTGSDSKYFNKYGHYPSVGAYQSKASPYYGWYSFTDYPDKYEAWWGFDTLPNVNELDGGFVRYIAADKNSVVKKWMRRGASGWRLDVADELPDEFIKILRKNIKEENPDALLIGEVWEDASNKISYGQMRQFLWGNSLDGVMNYVFRSAVLMYLVDANAELFNMRMLSLSENYPKEALYCCLNLISSHDVPRAATVLSGAPDFRTLSREEQHNIEISPDAALLAKKRMLLAVVLQMTLPGTPCIYYGDEIGMTGYADPFNRACFDSSHRDDELLHHTKKMAHLRLANDCLRTGAFVPLYYVGGIVCYMREITESTDIFGNKCTNGSIVVVVNAATVEGSIELNLASFFVSGYTELECGRHTEGNMINCVMPPMSHKIFFLERNGEKCVKIQSTQQK